MRDLKHYNENRSTQFLITLSIGVIIGICLVILYANTLAVDAKESTENLLKAADFFISALGVVAAICAAYFVWSTAKEATKASAAAEVSASAAAKAVELQAAELHPQLFVEIDNLTEDSDGVDFTVRATNYGKRPAHYVRAIAHLTSIDYNKLGLPPSSQTELVTIIPPEKNHHFHFSISPMQCLRSSKNYEISIQFHVHDFSKNIIDSPLLKITATQPISLFDEVPKIHQKKIVKRVYDGPLF